MKKIIKVFFSPSGTTKKVVGKIAGNFKQEKENCDLLNFDSEREFGENDIVIVGMPVFAGRIPKTASERLSKLTGNNTKAIAVVNYGNAHVTDALLELVDILKENNFDVIAAASTISHHSIFDGVAVGRPDSSDIEKINEFAQKCIEKIESGESLQSEIPGNRPYTDYKQLPFVISCDETVCAFCYDCVSICPEHAIPEEDPVDTDLDLCSRCTACIHICQEDARMFTGEAFESKKPAFEQANSERKEPEFYL
ncbi:ferredoxin [Methanobrevibacter sp. YE315]|uniref:flavodoxin domain-containing protein n=1 Tax=Methanobrevibacter sp. YE315 TaxID=1609968 RepID=UPI000764E078|nr:flavodoxin domain-containing protein [Methanobrevibacter sp. YE315]AMD17562.1 ferredoxin [Methanobrevibacter sp. YE315]